VAAPYTLATKQQPASFTYCRERAYRSSTAETGRLDWMPKPAARQPQTAEASQTRQQHNSGTSGVLPAITNQQLCIQPQLRIEHDHHKKQLNDAAAHLLL